MNKKSVLVVDDDADMGMLVSILLSKKGYETQVCHNGTDALAWLRDHKPDLAILDVMSRPSTLIVSVSPTPTSMPRAAAASNETRGGPL